METIEIRLPAYIQQNLDKDYQEWRKVEIEVPKYSPKHGALPIWEENYRLDVQVDMQDGSVEIALDKGGLISLARHLLTFVQDEVPVGSHIHYDGNTIDEGSYKLIIGKIRSST
jgi:hypothetical protein